MKFTPGRARFLGNSSPKFEFPLGGGGGGGGVGGGGGGGVEFPVTPAQVFKSAARA